MPLRRDASINKPSENCSPSTTIIVIRFEKFSSIFVPFFSPEKKMREP